MAISSCVVRFTHQLLICDSATMAIGLADNSKKGKTMVSNTLDTPSQIFIGSKPMAVGKLNAKPQEWKDKFDMNRSFTMTADVTLSDEFQSLFTSVKSTRRVVIARSTDGEYVAEAELPRRAFRHSNPSKNYRIRKKGNWR